MVCETTYKELKFLSVRTMTGWSARIRVDYIDYYVGRHGCTTSDIYISGRKQPIQVKHSVEELDKVLNEEGVEDEPSE